MCLQYGVPLKTLVEKFAHSRFEPSGFTKNPDIPIAKSLTDYIFRWLGHTFLEGFKAPAPAKSLEPEHHGKGAAAPAKGNETAAAQPSSAPVQTSQGMNVQVLDAQFKDFMEDAPVCDQCGAITVRNGACYRCYNCGNSMGCS
jgi:ribonucleoside-diphosphate reductase alpha chain